MPRNPSLHPNAYSGLRPLPASGEDLFDLFMAPSSQRLEPPQFPGRFSDAGRRVQQKLPIPQAQ